MPRGKLWKHPQLDDLIACVKEGQSVAELKRRFNCGTPAVETFLREYNQRSEPDTEKAVEELANMDMQPEDVSNNLPATVLYGGFDVMEEILAMKNTAERLRRQAETADKTQQAISALREELRIFELMTKMATEMRRRGDYNPWAHPDVVAYQEGMIEILRKHPAALEDVIEYIDRFSRRAAGSSKEGKGK